MMTACTVSSPTLASINGVALHRPDETLDAGPLRQRACTELLRQAAQAHGLLATADQASPDGVISQAASEAIEQLLAQALPLPEPDEAACRRHHAAQPGRWRRGERVRLRHILFAVTPGVDVRRLRERAEQVLLEVRCAAPGDDAFSRRAAELSNCPSGARGGDLDWLATAGCAPELAREVFGSQEVGVLPRLVHSRFGLHVVDVMAREPGVEPPFESVASAVRLALQQQAWATALQQYLQVLAGQARLVGVPLDGSDTPLVQ
jgi:peptidyl-prolyl cis-trans isomerase C